MKTTVLLTSTWRRLAVFATAGLLTLSTVSAEVRTYRAKWSGAAFENTATAVADFVIDESKLFNPGEAWVDFDNSLSAILSVTLTVSGASSGNGTFTTEHFWFYQMGIADPLNLDTEWVGQSQPSLVDVWGSSLSVYYNNHFTLRTSPSGAAAGAPQGFELSNYDGAHGFFWLRTSNGSGDRIQLTSFKPLSAITVGEPVANVSGAIVSAITPPEVASDGNLYLSGKLKGEGVTSANDSCLLKWDGEIASVLIREGDSLAGGSILAFGYPISEGENLFFQAKLLSGGTVTKANDEVLARVSTAGGGQTVIAREGSPAPGVSGFNYLKVIWMHPTANGLFFGATIVDDSDPTKRKTGVWFNNGTSTSLKVVTGGTLKINGTTHVVKAISKPGASGPVSIQTRVGNPNKIALLIKTTDSITVLREFMH